jgi:hypothetical protein
MILYVVYATKNDFTEYAIGFSPNADEARQCLVSVADTLCVPGSPIIRCVCRKCNLSHKEVVQIVRDWGIRDAEMGITLEEATAEASARFPEPWVVVYLTGFREAAASPKPSFLE